MSKQVSDCCKPIKANSERKGFFWGIFYGILPHTFCILFVVFSVLGATAGSVFLKKFLVVPYFFQALIGLSIVFAIISATIYLKKTSNLSLVGAKRKWKYLTILFVTTISINLLVYYFVLPFGASIGSNKINSVKVDSEIKIENGVQIVRMTQTGRGYIPNTITIKKNMPVKWIITGTNTGFCSASIYSKQLKIQKDLVLGENIFEFTPNETGKIKFSCIMGMYTGYFNVVD